MSKGPRGESIGVYELDRVFFGQSTRSFEPRDIQLALKLIWSAAAHLGELLTRAENGFGLLTRADPRKMGAGPGITWGGL